jgi:cysteine desulfurase family protein
MKPPEVAQAVAHAINTFGSVGRGVHAPSIDAGMAVFETREKIAHLFGVPSAKNVAFTANATEAINIVVAGLLGAGDHAITTAASHNSVLRPLYQKQARGADLSIVPLSEQGALDLSAFAQSFKPTTRLVIVTHGSNLTGEVYDIEKIAQICNAQGVFLAIDAAQTAGHIPINMQKSNIDIVIFTGHKSLFGPQGTGGICLNQNVLLPPFMVGGSGTQSYEKKHPTFMPECLEAGTLNSHGIAGLSAGLDYIEQRGIDSIAHQVDSLVKRFESGISKIEGIVRYGKSDPTGGCGIVAINVADKDSALISDVLATEYEICTRAGAHCAPLMHKALKTHTQGIVRFSFSPFNTEEEVDTALEALSVIAQDEG